MIREDGDFGGYTEVLIAPEDVKLKVIVYSRGSSEIELRVTDVTSRQLVGVPGSQTLIVGGSQSGIRQVELSLRPTRINVSLEW